MELTTQDIQKIDNYLKKGIKYWDIRLEMIDHLASKLEDGYSVEVNDTLLKGEFGVVWGDYFINKTQQIKKQVNNKYRKLVAKQFLAFFTSFTNVFLVSLVILIEWFLFSKYGIKSVFRINSIPFILFIFYALYYINVRSFRIKKSFTKDILTHHVLLLPLALIGFVNLPKEILSISKEIYLIIFIIYMILATIWIISGIKVFSQIIDKHKQVFNQYKSLNV